MTTALSYTKPAHASDLSPFPALEQLRCRAALPFRTSFHPMGYPVEINTNSGEVLSVAKSLWLPYPVLSGSEPVRIRVIANTARSGSSRTPFPPNVQEHLCSIVHGPDDFAIADLSAGFAFVAISRDSIADHRYFRYHFLEPLVYLMLGSRHFVFVHASCISRNGGAILLCGESGAGKTCLAYACARRGWEFVSGDAVHIVRERRDCTVIGRPYEIRFRPQARELFPELYSFPVETRASGKSDLEVDTALLGIPTKLQSVARHIVFIERAGGSRLERCSQEVAMRTLERTICFGDDQCRLEQRTALAHFVKMTAWRLCYSDLEKAEALLGSLPGETHQC
jgi:hypothetical protein